MNHFRPSGSSWVSEIDSANFFLSANGKYDSRLELEATLAMFMDPKNVTMDEEASPMCRFPARRHIIETKLKQMGMSSPLLHRDCPRYDKWFREIRGESLSLVFSSYYLNNPSSTYGHTLIRINKAHAKDGKRYELLDYGVNYAANMTTTNPFVYAALGLFGGFTGSFSIVPYYYKVREYNNNESRDLWDYQLNLTPAETFLFTEHVWELGPAFSYYWYLSINCAYYMLAIVESAKPELHIVDDMKKFVIPTDTVKIVFETPGLVKSIRYRPSVLTQFEAREKRIDSDHIGIFKQIVLQNQFPPDYETLGQEQKRDILDAAIDYMDYSFPHDVQTPGTVGWERKNRILAERSAIPLVSEELIIPTPMEKAPHAGHGTRRMGVGYLSSKLENYRIPLNYRFAYHDFLDAAPGFPDYAQITFFDMHFSWVDRKKRFLVDDFNIFEVTSLNPITDIFHSTSWGMKLSINSLVNEQCQDCLAGQFEGRYGWSVAPFKHTLLFGGLKALAFYTGQSDLQGAIGGGPDVIVRATWSPLQQTYFEAWYRKDFRVLYDEFKELDLSHQWSFTVNSGVRFHATTTWFEQTAGAEYFMYY